MAWKNAKVSLSKYSEEEEEEEEVGMAGMESRTSVLTAQNGWAEEKKKTWVPHNVSNFVSRGEKTEKAFSK